MDKRRLYNKIMRNVSDVVMSRINESVRTEPTNPMYPVAGYPGWYVLIDGRLDVNIYHDPDFIHPVCLYYTCVDNTGAVVADDNADLVYRDDLYKYGNDIPALTDEEYDTVESVEFSDAVFYDTLPGIPHKEFHRYL